MNQPMTKKSDDFDILASGRSAIEVEIQGLQALAGALDESFVAAVRACDVAISAKGRVIVTGMGKSGHVARKIAATMASTGTPAHFVHPAEASHGDLGMITQSDVVIALSNSGETKELSDMIHYCSRYDVPLIGLVRRAGSMLVEAADIAVVLPEVAEATQVPAPTTSTTMMMAYGDALAVALLEMRGFTKDDFGNFHPGGKLGAAFIRVSEIMHGEGELPLVPSKMQMDEVLLEMTSKSFGCVGVTNNDGTLAGIITDGDLRRHMNEELLESLADEVMTKAPTTTRPDALATEALAVMEAKKITCLFAVDAGVPKGIIHIHDCLRAGVV